MSARKFTQSFQILTDEVRRASAVNHKSIALRHDWEQGATLIVQQQWREWCESLDGLTSDSDCRIDSANWLTWEGYAQGGHLGIQKQSENGL